MNTITYRIEELTVYVIRSRGELYSEIIEVSHLAPEYNQAIEDALSNNQSPSWLSSL